MGLRSVGVDKSRGLDLELVLLAGRDGRNPFSWQDEERDEHLALDDAKWVPGIEAIEILLRHNSQSTFVEASLEPYDLLHATNVFHHHDHVL